MNFPRLRSIHKGKANALSAPEKGQPRHHRPFRSGNSKVTLLSIQWPKIAQNALAPKEENQNKNRQEVP